MTTSARRITHFSCGNGNGNNGYIAPAIPLAGQFLKLVLSVATKVDALDPTVIELGWNCLSCLGVPFNDNTETPFRDVAFFF